MGGGRSRVVLEAHVPIWRTEHEW